MPVSVMLASLEKAQKLVLNALKKIVLFGFKMQGFYQSK